MIKNYKGIQLHNNAYFAKTANLQVDLLAQDIRYALEALKEITVRREFAYPHFA